MVKKKKENQSVTFLLLIMGILFIGSLAYGADEAAAAKAAEPVSPAAATPAATTDPLLEHSPLCPHRIFHDSALLDKFHNPTDWIEMGLDQRIRYVYANNATTQDQQAATDNEWHYSRNRTRLSAKFKLSENVDFNTRLVWEWRHWDHPRESASHTDFDEMIFDTFNLTVRNLFDAPLTAVFGRQDINLGDGWLVCDGTPFEGSRTFYFDAARFTYKLSEETTADLIFISQFDDENKWISPINHRKRIKHVTNGQDEKGMILYVSNKSFENTTIDGYYIYKEDNKSRKRYTETEHAGIDSEIHTFGTRIVKKLDDHWTAKAEIAKQFGRKDKDKLDALGGTSRLLYAFNDENKNELFVDYEYLSGDKSGTDKDEEFDPLWGEFPQFTRGGDLQVYLWRDEGAVGSISNLHRIGLGHKFSPIEKWTFETSYNLLFADTNPYRNTAKYSTGGLRGQLLTAYWKYKCCKNLSYHFLVDYFMPGSYYSEANRDSCIFARFNIEFTF